MDISINTESDVFRLRGAGVIVKDNSILMVTNDAEDYYYSVGGGVLLGERVEDAVVREIFEETGIKLEIEKLLFVHQNYFKTDNNKNFHEVAFYFLMKYNGERIENKGITAKGYKEKFEWIEFDDFENKKIFLKFLPEFVKYNKEFQIITTVEN